MIENTQKMTVQDWQYQAINLVFKKHQKLKDRCFKKQTIELTQSAHEILESTAGYSSGEKVLIQIALDICHGPGNAKVKDLLEILDAQSFSNVLEGFSCLAKFKIKSEEWFHHFVNKTEASLPGNDFTEG